MAAPKNPKGSKPDKWWRDAIMRAVCDLREDPENAGQKIKTLGLIARRLCTQAIEGDVTAMKEIGDRLDGKAPQSIEANVNESLSLKDMSHQELARRLAFIMKLGDEESDGQHTIN